MKILSLTSVEDQRENKNTKNDFFFLVLPIPNKKNLLLVFKTTKISEEILVLLINEHVFRIQRSDKTIFEKFGWW